MIRHENIYETELLIVAFIIGCIISQLRYYYKIKKDKNDK